MPMVIDEYFLVDSLLDEKEESRRIIYKVEDTRTGEKYAMKIFTTMGFEDFYHERETYKHLGNQNPGLVVSSFVKDYTDIKTKLNHAMKKYKDNEYAYILTHYCKNKDLFDFLTFARNRNLPLSRQLKGYMFR